MVEKLRPFINGNYVESKTDKFSDIYDPSTGEVIAQAPICTHEEVEAAVKAAAAAFPAWSQTPARRRADLMFKLRDLIVAHFDELTMMVARENGKAWSEAAGDVQKALEMTEFACGIPTLMMGEGQMNVSNGYDTVRYCEPLGVYAGIAPWNFPAMIPMGWMSPLAIACGNTYVLKAATATPMTCLRFAELYKEAGFPDGVLNIVTCSRNEAELLLKHPDVKGVTFVGSTAVGQHVYATAAAAGKRVQALCEAKNHALVLKDAPITRTAASIMNSAFGCAGERCMALPVIVVEEDGMFQSSIVLFRTDSEEILRTIPIGNALIYDLHFLSGNALCVLCEDALYFYDLDGQCLGSYAFEDAYLKDYTLDGSGFVTLVMNLYKAGNRYTVLTVGYDGTVLCTLPTSEQILDISASGRYLALLTSGSLAIYDQNLKEYDVSDNTTGASSAVMREDGSAILLANGHGALYVP